MSRPFWGKRAALDAIEWLLSGEAGQSVTVWAHYGGGFDWRFVLERVAELSATGPQCTTVGSIVLSSQGRTHSGVAYHLLDSLRLLPAKLEEIARAMGMTKPALYFEHAEWRGDACECIECSLRTDAGRLRVLKRCSEDARILHRAIVQATERLEEVGVDRLRTTLASCASHAIRKAHGTPYTPHGEYQDDTGEFARDVDLEIEPGVHGGRTEVFQSYLEDGALFDVQSSYSRSMVSGPLPWRYRGEARKWREKDLAIVDAEIEVPEQWVPPLPMMHEDRLYFPTGKFRGWFAGSELIDAQSDGSAKVNRVFGCHVWDGSLAMAEFARAGWEKRKKLKQSRDEFGSFFFKRYLNAGGFGKFAEDRKKLDIRANPPIEENPEKWCIISNHLPFYGREISYQPAMRNIATAIWILADARIRLRRQILLPLGDSLCMCDTDSGAGRGELPTGKELGDLEKQATIARGWFAAPKLYLYVCAGCDAQIDKLPISHPHVIVKGKGLPDLNTPGWFGYAKGEAWQFERSLGFREALKRGTAHVVRISTSRQDRGIRPKRAWVKRDEFNWTTRPWSVDEILNTDYLRNAEEIPEWRF